MPTSYACAALASVLVLYGCHSNQGSTQAFDDEPPAILVQGAMPSETELLIARLENRHAETIGAWTFWHGRIDGQPVVVSKTRKGEANVAAATAIALERFHPSAVLNEGTAGGHDPALHVYDIVLGGESVNLGSFKTAYRGRAQGSNPLEWTPLDLLASEGSAGMDPNARTMRRFRADPELLAAAEGMKSTYQKGRVVTGVIGSSDVWNSELDRIEQFHRDYRTSVEDMETASAAQIAADFHVRFLGIRVVSNNITNSGAYDGKASEAAQEFVGAVIRAYARTLAHSRR